MMIPQPNAIASQGTSRPGPTSTTTHSRIRWAKRRAKLARLFGQGEPDQAEPGQVHSGRGPAASQGRHTSARPRALPSSTIAHAPHSTPQLAPCYSNHTPCAPPRATYSQGCYGKSAVGIRAQRRGRRHLGVARLVAPGGGVVPALALGQVKRLDLADPVGAEQSFGIGSSPWTIAGAGIP